MNTSSIRSGDNLARFDRRADHMGTELVRAERGEIAHEPAMRRTGRGDDDDRIGSCGHGGGSSIFRAAEKDVFE